MQISSRTNRFDASNGVAGAWARQVVALRPTAEPLKLVRGAKGRAAAFDGRAVRGRMIAVFGPVRQIESG
jgi:hypothetical protein